VAAILLLVVLLALSLSPPLFATISTARVSVASDGTQANDSSYGPAVSADGRYVAFESYATNLVPDDTNMTADVFVHDRETGQTERVSVASDGTEGNGFSAWPALSADGRYVAFCSSASNLVAGDTNGEVDVFVHDRQTGETERVSVASDGTEGNCLSDIPSISSDGRYVAFQSCASNLVPDDTNMAGDVFVHDRQTGQTERVSVANDGSQANGGSGKPSISADGRYVAFVSCAPNLVAGDTNSWPDIFVHDRQTGQTERMSVASDGTEADRCSDWPSVSADGRYVTFTSIASNLVAGDMEGTYDVFVHDRQTGETERVCVASDGTPGNGRSIGSVITADGRYVAFGSDASNLVPGDTNNWTDNFVRDRQSGRTWRVSVASDGTEGNDNSGVAAISADGRYVAWYSPASNLVVGDTNGCYDIFVRDWIGADFSGSPSKGKAPLVVEFADLSTNSPTSWLWDFGDANTSTEQDPSHEYDHPGAYTVTLTASNAGGSDTQVRERYIKVSFSDVPIAPPDPADYWALDYILACVDAAIVAGYPDGTYRPTQPVDRAQMAVYIARGLVSPSGDAGVPSGPAVATFPDVPTDHWAYRYVEYCHSQGIVQGYWDGYHPDETVNRAQMAVYIARSLVAPSGDAAIPEGPPTPTFPDVPTSHWAYDYVEYCYDQGVIQGYWDGYHPDETVNRAQMAVFVQRAFKLPM
jgi:PKD repeat protein